MTDKIFLEKKREGNCKIDIEQAKKEWNPETCVIYRMDSFSGGLFIPIYRLVEHNPLDPEEPITKVNISRKTAFRLIKALKLSPESNIIFPSCIKYYSEK